jgi:hypothetical protein
VAARSLEGQAVPTRGEGAVNDALVARAVEDHRRRRFAALVGEQMLRSAEIPRALLAGGADEVDWPLGRQARAVEHLRVGEHRGHPPPVVSDARPGEAIPQSRHADPRLPRKDGVEVGAHEHGRSVRTAWAASDHVPGLIDAHITQLKRLEPLGDPLCPLVLLPGRRGDLRHGDLLANDFVVVRREMYSRLTEGMVMPELAEHGCN